MSAYHADPAKSCSQSVSRQDDARPCPRYPYPAPPAEPLDFTGLKAKRAIGDIPPRVFIGSVTTEERIEHASATADPNAGIHSVSYENPPLKALFAPIPPDPTSAVLTAELVAIARRFEWVMSNRVVPALIGLALAIFSQGLWA